jgi:hypothetical protein
MNASEAREIISKDPEGSQYWDCEHDIAIEYGHAHGYLEALNGPEVKALIEQALLQHGKQVRESTIRECAELIYPHLSVSRPYFTKLEDESLRPFRERILSLLNSKEKS